MVTKLKMSYETSKVVGAALSLLIDTNQRSGLTHRNICRGALERAYPSESRLHANFCNTDWEFDSAYIEEKLDTNDSNLAIILFASELSDEQRLYLTMKWNITKDHVDIARMMIEPW